MIARPLIPLPAAALLLAAAAPAAAAEAAFDNPGMGSAPCVVLNQYAATTPGRGDAGTYAAFAELENICGRTVDVAFCFQLAEASGGEDALCVDGIIRPWSTAKRIAIESPVRITGPQYRWRYRPLD